MNARVPAPVAADLFAAGSVDPERSRCEATAVAMPRPAPSSLRAPLPTIWRLQSIRQVPFDARTVRNEAVLFHAHASLKVAWLSRKIDTRLMVGALVRIDGLAQPVSVGEGAVRVHRLVPLARPEAGVNLFQTLLPAWVADRGLASRAADLWARLPTHFRHLFNAILWDAGRCERFVTGPGSLNGHHARRNGNLCHTVEVAEQALALSEASQARVSDNGGGAQPLSCPDVLLLAALLHDAGKADEYELTRSGYRLSDRGRLIGHRQTVIEWIAAARERSMPIPEGPYLALIHALTSARGAPAWLGMREPRTLDATLLSTADRLSGTEDLMQACAPRLKGFGRNHPHLKGAPFVV